MTAAAGKRHTVESDFARCGERLFAGYARDPDAPGRSFAVDILVDGLPIMLVRADAPVPRFRQSRTGHGFEVTLDAGLIGPNSAVEARIANSGEPVGQPIRLRADPIDPESDLLPRGEVEAMGGLRFSGWIRRDERTSAALTVRAEIEGHIVAEARCTRWTHVGSFEQFVAGRMGFDLFLPDRFGDGVLRTLRVIGPHGELPGSPLSFVAYADGMQAALEKAANVDPGDPRARLVDSVLPRSVPLGEYPGWSRRFVPPAPRGAMPAAAVVLLGDEGIEETLGSLDAEERVDWAAASVPGAGFGFDRKLCGELLARDFGGLPFVVFARSGTVFRPGALARIVGALASDAAARAVYADFEVSGSDGGTWPVFLPAFDGERMMEQGYAAQIFAMRTDAARGALERGAESAFGLFLDLVRQNQAGDILHLPGVVGRVPTVPVAAGSARLARDVEAHLRASGVAAEVLPGRGGLLPAVRVRRRAEPARVDIVIPTRDRLDLLEPCIASILRHSRDAVFQITVVDNRSFEPETLAYLARFAAGGGRVVKADMDFNYAAINNLAVRRSDADFVCLVNNDVEATNDDWLAEMLSRAAAPNVAAVGALLSWPSGIVQHGGVVVGTRLAAFHAFNDRMEDDAGYGDLLRVAHERSALTGACLLVRRADYLAVGGLDETLFPVAFNDVDLCLKLRAAGKRVVFTPHARLRHHESASRGRDERSGREARFRRELNNLRARWPGVLADDPSYSPLLGLDPTPYQGLAWPPRSFAARRNTIAAPRPIPSGMG